MAHVLTGSRNVHGLYERAGQLPSATVRTLYVRCFGRRESAHLLHGFTVERGDGTADHDRVRIRCTAESMVQHHPLLRPGGREPAAAGDRRRERHLFRTGSVPRAACRDARGAHRSPSASEKCDSVRTKRLCSLLRGADTDRGGAGQRRIRNGRRERAAMDKRGGSADRHESARNDGARLPHCRQYRRTGTQGRGAVPQHGDEALRYADHRTGGMDRPDSGADRAHGAGRTTTTGAATSL